MTENENERAEGLSVEVNFAAIDKTLERLIPSSAERRSSGGTGMVIWGTRNNFPAYLDTVARTTATLKSIILGCVDYVAGDDVIVAAPPELSWLTATKAIEIIRNSAEDLAKIGGLVWLVTRAVGGGIADIEPLPIKYIRTDEDWNTFWYSEKWRSCSTPGSAVKYDRWNPANPDQEQGIVYVRWLGSDVYPEAIYYAALKACEIERQIDDYHLGDLLRGFVGSVLVNFNGSGAKTDAQKAEIERDFSRKFGGARNGGRMGFSWNPDVKNRTTIDQIHTTDFGDKYDRLAKRTRQQIFTAFRANSNLFGIPITETNGFNTEEFESAFRLFNRTTIRPMQRVILDAFASVLGGNYVEIRPFTLDGADNTQIA